MDVVRILNPDGLHPVCAHPDCKMLALAGYCEATCCVGFVPRRAYCSLHSHAPQRVLEVLGHSPTKQSFTYDEARQLIMSMWAGAGLVLENAGKFEMERDLEFARSINRITKPEESAETPFVNDSSVGRVGE